MKCSEADRAGLGCRPSVGNVGDLGLAPSRSTSGISKEGRKGGKKVGGGEEGEGKMEKGSGEEEKDLVRNEPKLTLMSAKGWPEGSLGEGPS